MKTFIDPKEQFIITIPDDWFFTSDYYNGGVNKQPYGFEPYKKRNIAFQISYINNKSKLKFNIPEQPKGKSNLKFIKSKFDGIISWLTLIQGGMLVIITYTYSSDISSKQRESDLIKVKESVKSLLIFNECSKKNLMPRLRWDKFMLSYAASIDLVNRAYDNGSFIELVILLANQIDAVLRQSIILKKQLVEKTDIIDMKFIYQSDTDKPIMEKSIYKIALNTGVLDKNTYDNLLDLYTIRNKTVHRYIISDLRSDDIIQLSWSYTKLFDKLSNTLIRLEECQYHEQIGIYKGDVHPGGHITEEMTKSLIAKIKDKHGNRKLNRGITIGKNK